MKTGVDDFLVNGHTAADLNGLPRQVYEPNGSGVSEWPVLAPEALYGLAGHIVTTLDPYTEADPAAVLVHILVGVGNLIGSLAHARVQHDEHPGRLFAGFVGASGKGRKGLAWSSPRHLLSQVDEGWAARRIQSGLSSGEGLISSVRDERWEKEPLKDKGRVVEYQDVMVDSGEPDKRLLVFEPELAVVLKRMHNEGNSLSGIIRAAWDSGNLSTLTKSPLRATGAHISLIGHITREELRGYLTETERANGFANRFLWLLIRRSKQLPKGDPPPEHLLTPFIEDLRAVKGFGSECRRVERDPKAEAMWAEVYGPLSEGQPGMVGAITSRAESQVLRLSLLYALLDCSPVVRREHLKAALAVWDYAETSARLIFGNRTGNPVADAIVEALRLRATPMTRTAISSLFGRNQPAERIQAALSDLQARQVIHPIVIETGGRPAEAWELAARPGVPA